QIWRLAAPRAGAGELEERLQQLDVLHQRRVERRAVRRREPQEEAPVDDLGVVHRPGRHHVNGLVLDLALALGRAQLDAEPTARAVLGRHLKRVTGPLELAPLRGGGLESGRRARERHGRVYLGADDGVRTDQHALAALDAKPLVPGWNLERDVALLPAG